MDIDSISFQLNAQSEIALGLVLALIMVGVGIELRLEDFRQITRRPAAAIAGLSCLVLLLPAVTFVLVRVIDPPASVKLGMMVVAACPSGNISNFINYLARGNLALSVSITGISGLVAVVSLPLNTLFWAGLDPDTDRLLHQFAVEPLPLIGNMVLTLGLPLLVGAAIHRYLPLWAERMRRPLQIMSFGFLILFIVIGVLSNRDRLGPFLTFVLPLVALHNGFALALGFLMSWLLKLTSRDMRTVMIEVGMHNSGLGLALILTHFPGLGGAALIAAGWGVWHLVSGLGVAGFWRWFDRRRTA